MPDADWEADFRRRRFAQLKEAFELSPDRVDGQQLEQHRAVERAKVITFLDAFKASGDLEELRHSLDSWSKTTGKRFGFQGPNGPLRELIAELEALSLDIADNDPRWNR